MFSHKIQMLIQEIAKKREGAKVIVQVNPTPENKHMLYLLASIYEIDFVFVGEGDLRSYLQEVSLEEKRVYC